MQKLYSKEKKLIAPEIICSTIALRIGEGHANALALNKDCTQIAVAGRSLLKLYAIDNGFTEVCNMRGGKNQNLSYSSNDVAWSALDNNILATAATNGVVSVWDLSKFGRQKQALVYNEHERTAHTVTFHSSEPNILISGSQDGTIKCFDTRCEKSVNTYFSNSESVRDVKFSPHNVNVFAAVSENGTVQLWDMRRWDKCLLQFTAHSGPIYTCDWHPKFNWLATGSRDKQIKVWNMEGKASLEHTIHTIAVVGRVKWRPERTYHIASCALVVDYSIHVWDVRRPYVPFASFNDHTNVTTGIAWKGGDSHCLLSTSKDSTIYKHAFRDAVRPALKANAQGVSLGRRGDISYAKKIKNFNATAIAATAAAAAATTAQVVKSSSANSSTSLISTRQHSFSSMEQFHMAQSDMCQFLLKSPNTGYISEFTTEPLREDESFIQCAKHLLLIGKKLSEICEHNANVTRRFGKHDATTLWNFIKMFYCNNSEFNQQKFEHRSSFSNQRTNSQTTRRVTQVVNLHEWEQQKEQQLNGEQKSTNNGMEEPGALEHHHHQQQHDDVLTVASGPQNASCSVIVSETQVLNEITFDNFDMLLTGFIYVGPPDFSKLQSLPETALHHDVQAARPQMDIKAENREKSPSVSEQNSLKVSQAPPVPMWEPNQFITDSLILQCDVGDVQTALTILIAMGEARKFLPIPEALVEHWFLNYIDQLHRYQLWNEACTIVNLAWPRAVRELNQKSTTVHTNCGECGRPLGVGGGGGGSNGGNVNMAGWYCQKCKSMQSAKCSVCGLIVRGLFAWCQGCGHGGHLLHVKEYFANHTRCGKCGHLCEYN